MTAKGIEPGEAREGTLVRELQEELGITPTGWTFLETVAHRASLAEHQDEPSAPLTVHLFLVTAWKGAPRNRQPEEHSAIGWFSLAQAKGLSLADSGYPLLFARYIDAR